MAVCGSLIQFVILFIWCYIICELLQNEKCLKIIIKGKSIVEPLQDNIEYLWARPLRVYLFFTKAWHEVCQSYLLLVMQCHVHSNISICIFLRKTIFLDKSVSSYAQGVPYFMVHLKLLFIHLTRFKGLSTTPQFVTVSTSLILETSTKNGPPYVFPWYPFQRHALSFLYIKKVIFISSS